MSDSGAAATSSSTVAALQEATPLIERAYQLADRFGLKARGDEIRELCEQGGKLLATVDANTMGGGARAKALLAYLQGLSASALASGSSSEAEVLLSKAVRLDPKHVAAWNALAECMWHKGDLKGAKACFENALKEERAKSTLRLLSMLLRQMDTEPDRYAASVTLAKEAVSRDVKDGLSWYALGNAYSASFFKQTLDVADMQRAMQAYAQSEKDEASITPDLYYNWAMIELYNESYVTCIDKFNKAARMDPSLPVRQMIQNIEDRLTRTIRAIATRGGIKERKLSMYTAKVIEEVATVNVRGRSFKLLSELANGENADAAVGVRVIKCSTTNQEIPQTFVVIDSKGVAVALSVYNLAAGAIKEGDVLVVASPFLAYTRLQLGDHMFEYTSLRVGHPGQLLLNHKPVAAQYVAPSDMQVKTC